MSSFQYFNEILGIGSILPREGQVLDNQNLGSPINPYAPQIDTRQRRPLQGVQTDGPRIKGIAGQGAAKAEAFSARAKGIGARARVMDANRRNALGLSSQENRRRTQ